MNLKWPKKHHQNVQINNNHNHNESRMLTPSDVTNLQSLQFWSLKFDFVFQSLTLNWFDALHVIIKIDGANKAMNVTSNTATCGFCSWQTERGAGIFWCVIAADSIGKINERNKARQTSALFFLVYKQCLAAFVIICTRTQPITYDAKINTFLTKI